ncbi:holo-ACP synthase [Neisseria leonii]|uniref:holo-ACP synthase n=1 Tax=Neisseria leonii TaxID=2995413 RepID=UPI00237A90CE|nr:holo-ACP synthase [Neisseria sp. 3986]MDD9325137.1 holo-ACP synthase [Neisseria sp. 3986]
MIYGIGTDMVQLARMRQAYGRHGRRLAQRLLHTEEIAAFDAAADAANFLAKRFAAKEAFAKAVGTGIRGEVSFAEIGIRHDRLGRPQFFYTDSLAGWLARQGIAAVHVSLSDDAGCVLAFAVAEAV